MKGIILAGGSGTRLYPITKGTSKQLLPVYDKPMIYYPLSVLMEAGIKDILVITTPEDNENFKRLLGDGSQFGISLNYAIQPEPKGLAQAFTIGEDFIDNEPCAMVLGDNIYYGAGLKKLLNNAVKHANNGYATIFGYQVKDPERFGIMEYEKTDEGIKVLSVEEKPKEPKSDVAVTGLYFYPKGVSEMAFHVEPSDRGEVEITTLNDMYRVKDKLMAEILDKEYTWFDTGTFKSLHEAGDIIEGLQNIRDEVICCPEAISYENGWIDDDTLETAAREMGKNDYGVYLGKVLKKGRR